MAALVREGGLSGGGFLAAVVFLLLLNLTPVAEILEPRIFDLWSLTAHSEPSPNVFIVRIDSAAYEYAGVPRKEPLPRRTYVELLRVIGELKPKAVGLDVVFSDPEARAENVDTELAAAIGHLPLALPSGEARGAINSLSGRERFVASDRSIPIIQQSAKASGLVALHTDPYSGSIVRQFRGESIAWQGATFAEEVVKLITPDARLPGARDYITYYGETGRIQGVSARALLERDPRALLALHDKVLLIGSYVVERRDRHHTPRGAQFGVEIHATQVSNILNRDWIRRFPLVEEGLVQCILLGLLSLTILSLRPAAAALTFVSTLLVWLLAAYWGIQNGYYFPGVLPLFILFLVFVISSLRSYVITLREKRRAEEERKRILKVFGQLVNKQLADKLAGRPFEEVTATKNLWMVSFFSDIEGYGVYAEAQRKTSDPEGLRRTLNDYFQAVDSIIFEHEGTIFQHVGDAVFAIWGAPEPMENAPDRALQAALAIQQRLDELHAAGKLPFGRTRIGMHYAWGSVGMVGSSGHQAYSPVSDDVNIGQRLESTAKHFGVTILVSQEFFSKVTLKVPSIQLGKVVFKNKEMPVTVCTVFNAPLEDEALKEWESCMAHFTSRRWEAAKEAFLGIKDPRIKKAAELYAAKCDEFTITPPPQGWSGEIALS